MTEKLLSYYKVKGISSLLVCFTFIFCCVMTFIRYIRADFTLGLLDCVRYEDFVISRFCSMHFTATLARLKNIVRYTCTMDFVIKRFVKSRFHCKLSSVIVQVSVITVTNSCFQNYTHPDESHYTNY